MGHKFIATIQVLIEAATPNEAQVYIDEAMASLPNEYPIGITKWQYAIERGIVLTPKKISDKDIQNTFSQSNDTP